MRHSLPQSHQFYVIYAGSLTRIWPQDRRKLFTAPQGDGAASLNDVLSHQGSGTLAQNALLAILRGLLGLPFPPASSSATLSAAAASARPETQCGAGTGGDQSLGRRMRLRCSGAIRQPPRFGCIWRTWTSGESACHDRRDLVVQPCRRILLPRARGRGRDLVAVCSTDISGGRAVDGLFFGSICSSASLGSFASPWTTSPWRATRGYLVYLGYRAWQPRGRCTTRSGSNPGDLC